MKDHSSLQFFLENGLERLTILSELLDPLMKLVEGHRFLEQRPPELRLVVDEGDFRDWVGGGSYNDQGG